MRPVKLVKEKNRSVILSSSPRMRVSGLVANGENWTPGSCDVEDVEEAESVPGPLAVLLAPDTPEEDDTVAVEYEVEEESAAEVNSHVRSLPDASTWR